MSAIARHPARPGRLPHEHGRGAQGRASPGSSTTSSATSLDGLVAWLFRGLGQLGITLPTDFSLGSILDLDLPGAGPHGRAPLGEARRAHRPRDGRDDPRRRSTRSPALDVHPGRPARGSRRDLALRRQISSARSGRRCSSTAMEWVMTQIITSGTIKLLSFLDPDVHHVDHQRLHRVLQRGAGGDRVPARTCSRSSTCTWGRSRRSRPATSPRAPR